MTRDELITWHALEANASQSAKEKAAEAGNRLSAIFYGRRAVGHEIEIRKIAGST